MSQSELRDHLNPSHATRHKIQALNKDQKMGLLSIVSSYPTRTLCRITYCAGGARHSINGDLMDGFRAPGPPLTPVEGAAMRLDYVKHERLIFGIFQPV
jgi:hypothetical protein